MATPKEIQKQLEKIQKLYDQLGKKNPFAGADADKISNSTKEVQKLGDALEGVQNKVDNLDQTFSDLQTQLRNTINEIKKGPDATTRLAKGFRGVLAEVKKLTYEEEGLDRLSIDQLKNLKKRASQRQSDASKAAKDLLTESGLQGMINHKVDRRRKEYKNLTDAQKSAIGFLTNEDETFSEINKKIAKRIEFEEKVNKNLGLGGNLIKGIGGALEKMGMDGLAKQLGLDEAQEKMKEVAEEVTKSGDGLSTMQKKRKVLSAGFNSMGKSLIKNLKDPLSIGLFLFKGIFDAITAVDKQSGELAKNLNISYSEAAELSTELSEAANKSGSMTITTAGLGEALMAANGELGIFNTTIDDNLVLFQKLHKTAGLTYAELSGVKSITDATGGDLEKNTKEIMAQARLTGQKFGVALNEKEVLKDISNVSKATTLSLGKNPGQIAAAVSATKALGMEMSQVEGIADGLLDFESSIANELKAELLLGKNINLEKARQAALNNDIATVAEEIAKQAGSAAEFGEMNRIQQQALADAVGMSREELAKSLFVQEQIGNLTGEEYEIRKQQIERLEAKGLSQAQIKEKLGKQSINDLKHQNSVQENLNKSIAKMKEAFVSIAAPLMQLIAPVVDLLVPAFELLSYILVPISETFQGISGILTGNIESLGTMSTILGGIAIVAGTLYATMAGISAIQGVITMLKARENGLTLKGIGILIREKAIKYGGAAIDIIGGTFRSFSAIPIVGGILAAAAAAAGIGYLATQSKKGDDVMSAGSNSSGYGSRTLFGPEGAISLNNKDTVIAGTNLFDKGDDVISKGAGEVKIPTQDNRVGNETNRLLQTLIGQNSQKPELSPVGLYEVQ